MILKGSQRGGAKQLGLHLLKTEENEHVELHDIRGFVSEDVVGALREAEAVSKGTKCKQFLFSVSLNPPETENVRVETFEQAIAAIEEKHGLTDQPRVIVFHEKEGRRHCHAVWSRIDAETMTAKPLPFFKNKLMEVSKQLYLEHGWQMPKGFANARDRDPRNFTLAEWQQAKRVGRHAGELKADIQEAWAISDTRHAFSHALEERGLYLARGDRRGHVAVTFEGEVISIPRANGKKSKDVTQRLGKPSELRSVEETRQRVAKDILPKIASHVEKARADTQKNLAGLDKRRLAMNAQHSEERIKLDLGQKVRADQEAKGRAARFRKGLRGLLDRVTGKRAALEKQNQMEAAWALQRDREQRQALVFEQLKERQSLQVQIKAERSRHAAVLRELHHDRTNYRLMRRGLEPLAKKVFTPVRSAMKAASELDVPKKHVLKLRDQVRDNFTAPATTKDGYVSKQKDTSKERLSSTQDRLKQLRAKSASDNRKDQNKERLRRLRERKRDDPDRGPEFER